MGGSGGNLALLARGELGEVAVVVTLPVVRLAHVDLTSEKADAHLVVEDLGLAGGGVGDQGLVEDVEDILADLLQLALNLVAVLADGADVLVGALGLLLLLDGRDDAPAGTAGADDVLVGDREQVALVDGELAAELGDLLHVGDHLIVALGLLAQAGEESLAGIFRSVSYLWWPGSGWAATGTGRSQPMAAGRGQRNTPFALHDKPMQSASKIP